MKYIPLLIYGAIPLVGILFLGWDWREVFYLYWLGNITVGILTVIEMMRVPFVQLMDSSQADPKLQQTMSSPAARLAGRWFSIVFFCIHYGMFTVVHGTFVWLFVSGQFGGGALGDFNPTSIVQIWLIGTIIQVIIGLVKPYDPSRPVANLQKDVMMKPYARIIPLHLAIIIGGMAITMLGLPAAAALLLIGLYVIIELVNIKKQSTQQVATRPVMTAQSEHSG